METSFDSVNNPATAVEKPVSTVWESELQTANLPARADASTETIEPKDLPEFEIKFENADAQKSRVERLDEAWFQIASGEFDWRDSKRVIEDYRAEIAANPKTADREMNLRFQLSIALYMTGKSLGSPQMFEEGKAELALLAKDYPKAAIASPEIRGVQSQMNRGNNINLRTMRAEGFFDAATDRLNIGGWLSPTANDKDIARKCLTEAYLDNEQATHYFVNRLWPTLGTQERRNLGDTFAAAILEARRLKLKK